MIGQADGQTLSRHIDTLSPGSVLNTDVEDLLKRGQVLEYLIKNAYTLKTHHVLFLQFVFLSFFSMNKTSKSQLYVRLNNFFYFMTLTFDL